MGRRARILPPRHSRSGQDAGGGARELRRTADAQAHALKKSDVRSNNPVPVSIMPQGLTLGLKPGDFADLLAYLETLNGK